MTRRSKTTRRTGRAYERSTVPSPRIGAWNTAGRRLYQILGNDADSGYLGWSSSHLRCSSSCRISCFSYLLPHSLRSEEHTSELQSLMHISYAVFCLKKKK